MPEIEPVQIMFELALVLLDDDLATFGGPVGVPQQHMECAIPNRDWIALGRPGEVTVSIKPGKHRPGVL